MKKTNDALNSINGETTAAPCPACLLTSTYQGRLEINRFAVFFLWPRLTGPEPVVGVGGSLCSSSLLVYQSSVITPPASGWRLVWQLMHRLAGTGTQSATFHQAQTLHRHFLCSDWDVTKSESRDRMRNNTSCQHVLSGAGTDLEQLIQQTNTRMKISDFSIPTAIPHNCSLDRFV